MKTFKSYDEFTICGNPVFVIRRSDDPYKPIQNDELPKEDELVEVDGKEYTVDSAQFMGDSEFKWWPDILIKTK